MIHKEKTKIQHALISVSDKTGIVEFAQKLEKRGIKILSTGGTARTLSDAGVTVQEISDYTAFKEIMGGRVKTLHPKVFGGILGLRNQDKQIAKKLGIVWIDLVVCNLYPFGDVIRKESPTFEEASENIDIGGSALLRSGAKNMGWVTVITHPKDYPLIIDELEKKRGITFEKRKFLAAKAFSYVASYDAMIASYLENQQHKKVPFPKTFIASYRKAYDLRYGENPHQKAALYTDPLNTAPSLTNARLHQGKQLSYNNIADANAALTALKEFKEPACVVVKHANPCGVAVGKSITAVFKQAYEADEQSAFGGIIALNRECAREIAQEITAHFTELVLAPAFEQEALIEFAKKQNVRVLELGRSFQEHRAQYDSFSIDGGLLIQEHDVKTIVKKDLATVTKETPSPDEIAALLFAWKVVKHVKSNAIVIAKKYAENYITVGIGAGQVSRVDAVEIALKKAGSNARGAVLASDAFFPFRDGIDALSGSGISAIIQPGGSIRDKEIIDACNEHGIAMVFTGVRGFRH